MISEFLEYISIKFIIHLIYFFYDQQIYLVFRIYIPPVKYFEISIINKINLQYNIILQLDLKSIIRI